LSAEICEKNHNFYKFSITFNYLSLLSELLAISIPQYLFCFYTNTYLKYVSMSEKSV